MEGALEDDDKPRAAIETRTRLIAVALAGLGLAAMILVYLYAFFYIAPGFVLGPEFFRDHYAAIVGLPAAAAVSFVIVVFLRQADGPIEFKGLGFEFKGASGQVAMWVICFLAIAGAIKLCW